jgi:aminoglycoside phosphotransferase (APT) family kinase protein
MFIMHAKFTKIFETLQLPPVNSIREIEIGFTNKVYAINERYVVKLCTKEENEVSFEKEVFLYRFFSEQLPVPKIIHFDSSKTLIDCDYYVCYKIEGDNLYSVWHTLNEKERKAVIGELCAYLKIINSHRTDEFIAAYGKPEDTWQERIVSEISGFLEKIEKREIIDPETLGLIRKYIDEHQDALRDEKLGVVYWDVHFDNILVKNGKITGILDFEGSELMSIDYVLDLANRMQNYPAIYASRDEDEGNIRVEDYANIMEYYSEFYPELFDFDDIEKRIALYAIRYDLRLMLKFPNSEDLKERLLGNLED